MSTSTSYITGGELQDWAFNGQSPIVAEQPLIDYAIDAASRQVEEYACREFPGFHADTTTSSRVYAVDNPWSCWTDDIADATSVTIAVDMSGDGVFETPWLTTDFQVEPSNANVRGRPANLIRSRGIRFFPISVGTGYVRVNGLNTYAYTGNSGALATGVRGAACVQVTAKWGWPSIPPQVKLATLMQAHFLLSNRGAPLGVMGGFDGGTTTRVTSYLHPGAKGCIDVLRLGNGGLV